MNTVRPPAANADPFDVLKSRAEAIRPEVERLAAMRQQAVEAMLADPPASMRGVLRLCKPERAAWPEVLTACLGGLHSDCRRNSDPMPADPQALADALLPYVRERIATGASNRGALRRFDSFGCRAAMLRTAARYVRHDWPLAAREGGQRLKLGHERGDVFAYVDSRLVLRLTWAEDRYLLAESMPGQPERLNVEVDPE